MWKELERLHILRIKSAVGVNKIPAAFFVLAEADSILCWYISSRGAILCCNKINNMQNRISCVKCFVDGELSRKRKTRRVYDMESAPVAK